MPGVSVFQMLYGSTHFVQLGSQCQCQWRTSQTPNTGPLPLILKTKGKAQRSKSGGKGQQELKAGDTDHARQRALMSGCVDG